MGRNRLPCSGSGLKPPFAPHLSPHRSGKANLSISFLRLEGSSLRLSEEERLTRSFQDLHEALGQLPRQQDLTALSTSLQTLREQLTAIAVDTQPLNEQLQQLKETLSEAVQTLEEKIHQNDSDLAQQILRAITMIEEEEQEWQDRLSQSTAELRQSMDNTLTEQLEASNHHLKESVQQILADHRQAMQDHLSRQEARLEQLAQSAPAIEEHLRH